MLYLTTRNTGDAYTAYRVLGENRGPDGGFYVPIQLPRLTDAQVDALLEAPFEQCVAEILNLFFPARLDGADVEFCVGARPFKLIPMSHRIVIAECWHNPDYDFSRIVRNLSGRVRGVEDSQGRPSSWAWIAVRIAMAAGLLGEFHRVGILERGRPVDVSAPNGDFGAPMALWYAREMGLPIGTIICSCNDNSTLWDLLNHGSVRTDAVAIPTSTPEADFGVPPELERLVYATLGMGQARRLFLAGQRGRPYTVDEDALALLSRGLHAAVVGRERMEAIIRNVYAVNTYLLDPYAALAFGGLQDYRARVGEIRPAVIVAERSPICSAQTVAQILGITVRELRDRLQIG